MKEQKKPGEFDLISRYFAPLAAAKPGALGLLDDAAVLEPEPGQRLVVTTDSLVAGIHFPTDEDPRHVAARVLGVNLSDLAAMGAMPWAYTLSVAWPKDWDPGWVEGFAEELGRQQERYGLHLVGGDTVSTPGPLTLCLTAFGSVAEDAELRRSSARADDDIYVSGTIGDAALGLKVLQDGIEGLSPDHVEALVDRYRRPRPRLELGRRLHGLAHGVIDLSDGLVADLGHVARTSGCLATIDASRVPLSDASRATIALEPGLLKLALTGGDDYELLFTAPSSAASDVETLARELDLPLSAIGKIGAQEEGGKALVTVVDGDGGEWVIEDGGQDGGYRHF